MRKFVFYTKKLKSPSQRGCRFRVWSVYNKNTPVYSVLCLPFAIKMTIIGATK